MKKNLNKIKNIVVLPILFLIELFVLREFIGVYKTMLVLIFIVPSIYLASLIHELSHQIMAITFKMTSHVFMVYPFFLIKKLGKWSLKIRFKKDTDFFGFVIPRLPIIDNKNQYDSMVKKYVATSIIGPISNFLLAIICFKIDTTITEVAVFNSTLGFISLFMGFASLSGDGKKAVLFLKNPLYTLATMISLNRYSDNYYKNHFLYALAKENIKRINWRGIDEDNLQQITIHTEVIYYNLLCDDKELNSVIKDSIEAMLSNFEKMKNLTVEMENYFHIVILYFISIEKNIIVAEKIYEFIKMNHNNNFNTDYIMKRSSLFVKKSSYSLEELIKELEIEFPYNISENFEKLEKELIVCIPKEK